MNACGLALLQCGTHVKHSMLENLSCARPELWTMGLHLQLHQEAAQPPSGLLFNLDTLAYLHALEYLHLPDKISV